MEKFQKVTVILQTLAVVITLPLIYWQVSSDLDLRRKAQTMEHIASMTYRGDRDIRLCGIDSSGTILTFDKSRALYINSNPELKAEMNKLLAEFEFYPTGVNQNVFDFEVANKLNGGYTIEQYKRYFAYIQLVIDNKPDKSYKMRVYDQFEKLVIKLNSNRVPRLELPRLNRN